MLLKAVVSITMATALFFMLDFFIVFIAFRYSYTLYQKKYFILGMSYGKFRRNIS